MNELTEEIEKRIDDLGPSGFVDKHAVVLNVADLVEVPYTHFKDLQNDLYSGRTIVRLSPFGRRISSEMFSLFASSYQRNLATMIIAGGYLAPVLGIGSAIFTENWWWLVLLVAPLVTMRRVKGIYSKALFDAMGSSEKAFCFAFCGDVITVETADNKIRSRGRQPL